MLYNGQWASLLILLFMAFAITKLLKRDVIRVFFVMEIYRIMACAILLL